MDAAKAQKLARLQALIDAVPVDVDVVGASAGEEPERRGASRGHWSAAFGGGAQAGAPSGEAAVPRRGKRRGKEAAPVLPPEKEAYNRVVELCGYQDFCRAKMRERLRREGLPPAAIEDALARAVRIGLIDDLRWGEMRASALMRKGMGNSGIVRELKENGISAADIAGWPHEYEERFGGELDRALRMLEKNPPRSKNPRASAYGKLMRKGYAPDVASQATAIWFA